LTVSVKRIVRPCGRSAIVADPKEESNLNERTKSSDDTVISTVALDQSEVVRKTVDANKIGFKLQRNANTEHTPRNWKNNCGRMFFDLEGPVVDISTFWVESSDSFLTTWNHGPVKQNITTGRLPSTFAELRVERHLRRIAYEGSVYHRWGSKWD